MVFFFPDLYGNSCPVGWIPLNNIESFGCGFWVFLGVFLKYPSFLQGKRFQRTKGPSMWYKDTCRHITFYRLYHFYAFWREMELCWYKKQKHLLASWCLSCQDGYCCHKDICTYRHTYMCRLVRIGTLEKNNWKPHKREVSIREACSSYPEDIHNSYIAPQNQKSLRTFSLHTSAYANISPLALEPVHSQLPPWRPVNNKTVHLLQIV